ncbi:hypothetical protein [Acidisphaera sp. S103]|uniref:hypothetical protein n=1 Tax=Acidisphaera sp. S103 TaxID=1747223 RepID=UPI001C20C0B9|nr:hypothetical protein [Acidisphaera sp. S103]
MTLRISALAMTFVLAGFGAWAQSPTVTSPDATPPETAGAVNDYPTAARAEYVFACMATNGETRDALDHCSCAIDTIAAALPYSQYEKAETILRMRQEGGGYLAQEFRVTESNNMLRDLQEAQAEADVSCF